MTFIVLQLAWEQTGCCYPYSLLQVATGIRVHILYQETEQMSEEVNASVFGWIRSDGISLQQG